MLAAKPQNSLTPYILNVYRTDMAPGSARVVAKCDTRDGTIWRTTNGNAQGVTMHAIRAAIASVAS